MNYKKLKLRNIFGKPVKIEDNKSIETVATLPTTGKPGVIYHNTTDNKYYVYNDTSWEEFGDGVEQISNLTGNGEEGVIYYNTSDGKYYIWSENDSAFVGLVPEIPIIYASDTMVSASNSTSATYHVEHGVTYFDETANKQVFDYPQESSVPGSVLPRIPEGAIEDLQGFVLEPNIFYELGEISAEDTEEDNELVAVGGLRLFCHNNSSDVVREYMGRFTVDMGSANAFNLYVDSDNDITIIIPDDTPDFEDGHTYEFNISASVLAIKDITYTES